MLRGVSSQRSSKRGREREEEDALGHARREPPERDRPPSESVPPDDAHDAPRELCGVELGNSRARLGAREARQPGHELPRGADAGRGRARERAPVHGHRDGRRAALVLEQVAVREDAEEGGEDERQDEVVQRLERDDLRGASLA